MPPTYASDEEKVILDSWTVRIEQLERTVSDHAQRLETAQTHQWKRVWFWLQGWPMTDWNAPRRNWRPWARKR